MATVQKAVTFGGRIVSRYIINSELHVIWSMYLILINSLSLLNICFHGRIKNEIVTTV